MKKEVSQRITALQVLLIMWVIFSHNNSNLIENTQVSYFIKTMISEVVGRVAVPLFFFLSGYLLYRKETSYTAVLKKKAKTLLVPYLLWNSIVLTMFFVGQNVPFLSVYFKDEENIIREYSVHQWLNAYLGLNYHGYPAAYQLWFVRDLMILIVLFPIGKWLVQHMPIATLSALFVTWLMQWRVGCMDGEAVLFFMLGCYVVQYDINWEKIDQMKPGDIFLGYLLCLILEMVFLMRGQEFLLFHKVGILLGCLLWIRCSGGLVRYQRFYKGLEGLSGYTFFVYAFHEPFMTMMRKVWAVLFPMQGTAWLMAQYFGVVFWTILLSLGVAWGFRKIWPWGYGMLTGGRTSSRTVQVQE